MVDAVALRDRTQCGHRPEEAMPIQPATATAKDSTPRAKDLLAGEVARRQVLLLIDVESGAHTTCVQWIFNRSVDA